ncbi:MAG: hypothetical protein JXB35_06650, partial [Anaerolineae bacterium]|nr:hypothetical protein [Anaerolineae bacterium]
MMKRGWFFLGIGLLLASCGPTVVPGGVAEESARSAIATPVSPIAAPDVTTEVPAGKPEPNQVDALSRVVLPNLAAELDVEVTDLRVVAAEATTWPDASLGCPQEGYDYAQMLTPGWRLVVVDADGVEYVVHASEDGEHFVRCGVDGAPAPTSAPETRVHLLLAETLEMRVDALQLVSVKAETWSDASLGCPQPGMVYAQVVTPGWRFIFEDAQGTRYDVRTTERPTSVVLCEPGETAPDDP